MGKYSHERLRKRHRCNTCRIIFVKTEVHFRHILVLACLRTSQGMVQDVLCCRHRHGFARSSSMRSDPQLQNKRAGHKSQELADEYLYVRLPACEHADGEHAVFTELCMHLCTHADYGVVLVAARVPCSALWMAAMIAVLVQLAAQKTNSLFLHSRAPKSTDIEHGVRVHAWWSFVCPRPGHFR